MDFVFGDVNNDGFPDMAAGHQNGTIYLNDGTGNFTLADGNLPQPPGGSSGRKGPDLGDLDNDGSDELSFINSEVGISVGKWNAGNNWTPFSNYLPPTGQNESTQIYDMNLDGFADIIVLRFSLVPHRVSLFRRRPLSLL